MTVSWYPVIIVDILGSLMTLVIAIICANLAWQWSKEQQEDMFRDYIMLLTMAFVFFAVSRSFGHLIKQFLIAFDLNHIWKNISPFSGAVNSAAFIVIFAFGVYFRRFQRVHLELRDYKNNLEEMYACRTTELEEANYWLEKENRQRKKAEEELRQTMATLKNIFDSTAPTCITDLNHVLVEANESYQKLWPGPVKTGDPIKCYESRPGPICHSQECPLEKIKKGLEQTVCETVRKSSDGHERVFLQTTRPFRDADGNLSGTVTSFQEITERRKAQEELATERERLSVTLRSIGDGVITTDIDGRVVLLNKIAEKLCGWNQEEAKGKKLGEVFHIVDEKTGMPKISPVEQVLSTGNINILDAGTVLVSRDGSRKNIADSGAPIRDTKSQTIGVVLVFRDVTERLRMEKELQKTQKLESVGILAGGIAHDFNNILAAIVGNIDLAIHKMGKKDPVKPLLDEAERAAIRAKGLTQQLLTFAKGGSPILQQVPIEGLINESLELVLQDTYISSEVNIPDDLWEVEIDPGQIGQVIQNIVMNAREAMTEGGKVFVTARNLHGELENHSPEKCHWVEVTIADTGPGISPDVIDKIFDPYFSTKEKGSGLGLSICHSIIIQHQGLLKVDSSPGAGAVFTIYLPAVSNQTEGVLEKKSVEVPSGKKIRGLVMDDEMMVRKIVREMLIMIGVEPVLVSDGQEAVEMYSRALKEGGRYDLVILDLTIPEGMGGKEAAHEILELDRQARVIVASGYSNDPVMSSYDQYGFCAAVVKPFQLQELTDAVNKALHPDGKA